MIYLSGRLKSSLIGSRDDIGIMVSYRGSASREATGRTHLLKTVWAADNGCFSNPNIDVEDYLSWLERLKPYQKTCLFATAPDVVADWKATWERSQPILPRIRALGYKAALVAQDGMQNYPIRWGSFDCLFIGGSTDWKLSDFAFRIIKQAKLHGCHIHMGRVNSRRRIRTGVLAGCDSADGTQLVFAPDRRLKQLEKWLDEIKRQPFLPIH